MRAASSILSYPEGRAALAAARRGERLTASGYARARTEWESLHAELLVVSVDHGLAHRAGALAELFALRGHDAVHLACALSLATETTLVSWDENLRTAAASSGCTLAPPN